MDQVRLLDRVYWGLNVASRTIGTLADVYRPTAAANPLASSNRFLRMHAAFLPRRGDVSHTNLYGDALWHGIFDASYTRSGDYLVQTGRTLFIATQQGLAEPLCVQTNRRITIARAVPPDEVGGNAYGGIIQGNSTTLMENWPASVLGVGGAGSVVTGLPTDTAIPVWTVLLPAWPEAMLQPADLVSDDLGRSAVVTAAELTELGWRLAVKQVSS